jgi:hypothetical protein
MMARIMKICQPVTLISYRLMPHVPYEEKDDAKVGFYNNSKKRVNSRKGQTRATVSDPG